MAKYRHRIFEMYELREEAICGLTPKTPRPTTEAAAPKSAAFKHLSLSRSAGVTHVGFKGADTFGEDTVSELRDDLEVLADCLAMDSKVLFDFSGVKSFCAASIDALASFNQKLKNKGSRIALCCLDPAARECFFADRSP